MHDYQNQPIYRKGEEIYHLTSCIVGLVPEEDELLQHLRKLMLEDAATLNVKVAGALSADLYDMQMESAVLIRKAARDLITNCTALELYGFEDISYLPLLRRAIEEYRVLFLEWITSFNPWNYIWDDWGLFNPPGASKDEPDEI
ncbi:hypothetical protein POKO110462_11470 [Pontibacter korlensis]|uniref:Uncharacterized protein n=1 Tax=Pontibacter korlensis TaxID=400092 RepID=A0A0E3UXE4_9BACT|nr:hypothetical protein [Pontibacter korlensis]AKD04187.1 hypothetical protein PKOR_15190 [Pontibacter korlensis]